MTKHGDDRPSAGKGAQDTREDRLRAALRANLQRRKAQARARAEQPGAETGQAAIDPKTAPGSETGGDDN